MSDVNAVEIQSVRNYLLILQDDICKALEQQDTQQSFLEDAWQRPPDSRVLRGDGRTRVLSEGAVFEQAGINFSHVSGDQLPPAATASPV